jgi:hypothetical protein
MTIAMIVEDPAQSDEQTEQIQAHVRSTGPVPPEGARLVLGGPANPGWRVITVWDSADARDRFFAERLTPAYEAAGLSFADTTRTQFDVEMLMAGDLTGAPQAA